MTKQYELKLCSNGTYYLYHKGVLINNPYITFDKFHKEDAESIVGELNHLVEENEQLKFELKECREHKLFSRRQLEEENERLKQENKELRQYLCWQEMELEEMEDIKRCDVE